MMPQLPEMANALNLVALFLCLATASCSPPKSTEGPSAARLAPCPRSPNCVSSQSEDGRHSVEPLLLTAPPEAALDAIAAILGGMTRARVVFREGNLLAAEFRSRLGFVDDVHFLVDPESGLVHVRSASRVGYWDMGVNRRRVQLLRRALEGRI